MTMDEVLAHGEQHYADLAELEAITFDLLANCKLRKQLGPASVGNLPPAPTVIEQTLWLPWLAQRSGWIFGEYYGGELLKDED